MCPPKRSTNCKVSLTHVPLSHCCCCPQETVTAGTTTTVLRGLQPDTVYTVSLVPVYAEGEGKIMSENGKTSTTESFTLHGKNSSSSSVSDLLLVVVVVVQGLWEE